MEFSRLERRVTADRVQDPLPPFYFGGSKTEDTAKTRAASLVRPPGVKVSMSGSG
jgi:hypothetical protein